MDRETLLNSTCTTSRMKLRCRLPTGAVEVVEMDDDAPWIQFLMALSEKLKGTSPSAIRVMGGGFPPKALRVDDELMMLSEVVSDDSLLTIQVGRSTAVVQGVTDGKYVPPSDDRGVFVKRTVPGDNSCLFHACAYILKDKSRTEGPNLRVQCAEIVLANPQKFTAALLAMPPRDYAEWILKPTSWGGAVELMILSFLFQTEIVALDLQSGIMERFGEVENYATRGFVVYNGRHYDAIAVTKPTNMSSERDDQVLFNPRDERVLRQAVAFVKEGAASGPRK